MTQEWDPYSFGDGVDDVDQDGGGILVAENGNVLEDDTSQILTRLTTAISGAMFERKAAARGVLEAFRQTYYADEDVSGVIAVIEKLVDDVEQSVRTEMIDQMPHIALFCHEESPRLDFVVPQHILPHIVRLLTDKFTQVRQTSQSSLLILMERMPKKIASQVAETVLPIILEFTQPCAPDEYRTEIAAFMSKLAPLVGKDITVNSYLDRFCRLCEDPLFQIRRVCATSMGDLANVIGTKLTEVVILPKFLALCKDEVWGVRKGCAEVIVSISTVSQLFTRKKTLAPAFVALLQDPSRWVRISAYQTLGPFITTFAADDCSSDNSSSDSEQAFLERFSSLHTQDVLPETENAEDTPVAVENLDENLEKLLPFVAVAAKAETDNTVCVPTTEEESNTEGSEGPPPESKTEEKEEISTEVINEGIPEIEGVILGSNDKINEKEEEEADEKTGAKEAHDPPVLSVEEKEIIESVQSQDVSLPVHDQDNIEKQSQDESSSNLVATENIEDMEKAAELTESSSNLVGTEIIEDMEKPAEITEQITEEKLEEEIVTPASNGEEQTLEISDPESSNVLNVEVEIPVDMVKEETNNGSDEKENVNDTEEPMDTDEPNYLFDEAYDDTQQDSQGTDNCEFSTEPDLSDSPHSIPAESANISVGNSITDVHRSYLNLYNASRDQNCSDEMRMTSVRMVDPYDDDDWADPENTFPGGWGDTFSKGQRPKLLEDIPKLTVQQQDLVPPSLLEHFTSMSEPMKNQAIDNALTGFCVYNLPAVVLTLGKENWSILRECYESLACSMQWKIRYTLASSLHEIARIVGPELSERDLLPFFNALLTDVDEVRVGLLRNLADFIKILGIVERRKCLDCLRSFLETDNKRNWRFRLELTKQLEQLTEIYEVDEVYKYLRPIAVDLIKDGVAEVRKTALCVITHLILRVQEPNLVSDFLLELVETLCHSDRWVRRQTFASLSGHLIKICALRPNQFAQDILPHLISLSKDVVPNVRLTVAKTLVSCISKLEYFADSSNPHNEILTSTIAKLQCDTDSDVRFFSMNLIGGETENQIET